MTRFEAEVDRPRSVLWGGQPRESAEGITFEPDDPVGTGDVRFVDDDGGEEPEATAGPQNELPGADTR